MGLAGGSVYAEASGEAGLEEAPEGAPSADAEVPPEAAEPPVDATDAAPPGPRNVAPAPPTLAEFRARLAVLDSRMNDAQKRVDVLKDTALGGGIARAVASIDFQDLVDGPFELVTAEFRLNGKPVTLPAGSDMRRPVPLTRASLLPGTHDVEVSLIYRGRTVALFTYMDGYTFKVASTYRFEVIDGKNNKLHIRGVIHPDVTRTLDTRLGVDYDVERVRGAPLPDSKASSP